jgi:NADH:ubiquinone oxidoreductase subunit 6 (subunit J)
MIYITCIFFVALSQWIYRRGRSGSAVPVVLEKIVVLAAALLGLLAIMELGSVAASLFKSADEEFSGWLPGILVYPVAVALFVIFIMIALPKPIQRKTPEKES